MAYAAGQKLRASQMSVFVCTSTTRPAGHSGQIVYETDTGMMAVRTGSTWRYFAPTGEVASDAQYNANATQTIPNVTDTPTAFSQTDLSSPLVVRGITGAGHYFRAQRPGRWAITATIRWAALGVAAGGERYMSINRQGTEPLVSTGQVMPSGTAPVTMSCAVVARVQSGQENTSAADFHVNAFQGSGSSKDLQAATGWGRINLSWLGP